VQSGGKEDSILVRWDKGQPTGLSMLELDIRRRWVLERWAWSRGQRPGLVLRSVIYTLYVVSGC
jgi:hypothetical protein